MACLLASALQAAQPVLFEGARLIVDTRRPPIENGAFLVEGGRIAKIGKAAAVPVPSGVLRVNVSGKTVIPALIDTHVHLGYQKGLVYAAANFSRENIIDQLRQYAYCGIAAVLSLGTDLGDLPFQLRAEQTGTPGGTLYLTAGRGFAAPNAGPNDPELKPSAYGVVNQDEARKFVREQIARKVDFIKIWVDDRNGTVQKLSPVLYRAIIDEAHKNRTRVIAHVYYLDDAKDLVRAGIDGLAHLVRDREMDDEVVALIKQRSVFVMPNLAISENATHTQPPAWLDDPLLHAVAPAAEIDRARSSFATRSPEAIQRGRVIYRNMQRSLAKLKAARAVIGFGTDDGAVRDHFYAFTAHRELGLMVDGGLTPAEALTAATVTSAGFLRLSDRGTLEPGKSADFIILDGNPLDNISNTRKISDVYLGGQQIKR